MSFRYDTKGASAIEFALIAPVLVIIVIGLAELARYGIFRQQLADTVSTTVDLVARFDPADVSQIDGALALATANMSVFAGESGIRAIASGLAWKEDGVRVEWQRTAGKLNAVSEIGVNGHTATVPTGLVDEDLPTLVAVEITVAYESWLSERITGYASHDLAYTRPRRDRDLGD